MPTTKLTPNAKQQFFDANGNPLAGGKLYTYAAGTTTLLATYIDSTGTTSNANPIILDSRGEANVWLVPGTSYKFKLTDANDVQIWVVDEISVPASAGTVTSLSVVSANGFAGTVANPTTTPAITLSTTVTGLLKGNGTAISAATANTDYQSPITLTTTGTSGAATFTSNTLNIPQYASGGGGGSGLTLLSTTPLTNGLSTISVTDLASSKYFLIVINFWDFTPIIAPGDDPILINAALSSNNGSTYGSASNIAGAGNAGSTDVVYIHLTNISGVSKVIAREGTAIQYTSVTGVINAIQFTLTAGYTYTSSGNLYIYGMN